jgi:hypothetical protein
MGSGAAGFPALISSVQIQYVPADTLTCTYELSTHPMGGVWVWEMCRIPCRILGFLYSILHIPPKTHTQTLSMHMPQNPLCAVTQAAPPISPRRSSQRRRDDHRRRRAAAGAVLAAEAAALRPTQAAELRPGAGAVPGPVRLDPPPAAGAARADDGACPTGHCGTMWRISVWH